MLVKLVMPFPMKIQPIDFNPTNGFQRYEPSRPVAKSRFKRLFERQVSSVLRISAPEKQAGSIEEPHCNKDGSEEFEPSSVCLAKMVQNFIEESNEKQSTVRCSRNRCTCFNGNSTDSSEDDFDSFNCFGDTNHFSSGDACDVLKSLVLCASVSERNLLADTAKIVDKKRISKRKDDYSKNIVIDGLQALGYDASICKSRWEKSASYPAGEYKYVDVIAEGERLIVDIDFKSEFEIARPTKNYKTVLQTLPHEFVGKMDRLQRIISVVSDAAKQSLRKKGMPFPPWRKADYVKAKWLSPYTRSTTPKSSSPNPTDNTSHPTIPAPLIRKKSSCGELELIFGEKSPSDEIDPADCGLNFSSSCTEKEKALVE